MVEGSLLFSFDFFFANKSSSGSITESNETAEDNKANSKETYHKCTHIESFYFTFPPAADYSSTFESSFSTTDCETVDYSTDSSSISGSFDSNADSSKTNSMAEQNGSEEEWDIRDVGE